MASLICSFTDRTGRISTFSMNWSFEIVSKSVGSLMTIRSVPLSSASGMTSFSRAIDSGTFSMTSGGMTVSFRSTYWRPNDSAKALMTCSAVAERSWMIASCSLRFRCC
jgi:hypothetical protein